MDHYEKSVQNYLEDLHIQKQLSEILNDEKKNPSKDYLENPSKDNVKDDLKNPVKNPLNAPRKNPLKNPLNTPRKNSSQKRKALEGLLEGCHSDAAKSRVGFYVRSLRISWGKALFTGFRLLAIFSIFFVCVFTLYYKDRIYRHLAANDDTLLTMISDYEKGDIYSAYMRTGAFHGDQWDGAIVSEYMAKIRIRRDNDYDGAADILMRYLTETYGIENIRYGNRILTQLEELSGTDGTRLLSDEKQQEAEDFLKNARRSAEQYDYILSLIRKQEDGKALEECRNLLASGADCFDFAALYLTALINQGEYNEAYAYAMDFVRNDSSYQGKATTLPERRCLISLLRPYIGIPEQKSELESFLSDGLPLLKVHEGAQYAHDEHYINDLNGRPRTKRWLEEGERILMQKGLMRGMDVLKIADDPTIISGTECYDMILLHREGGEQILYVFHYDIFSNSFLDLY